MKKYLPLAAIGLFAGCGRGFNETLCRESVCSNLKTLEVWTLPRSDYKFIARKPDGSIVYVETLGLTTNISAMTVVFGPTKKLEN